MAEQTMERATVERLHGYPKVWNMGHPAIADLFDGPVVVQEKLDGSQFTFGVIDGTLHLRSRRSTIHGVEAADTLFRTACETAARLMDEGLLEDGWQYRAEALCRPKHNTLEYGRAPECGMVLFDVDRGLEDRVAEPDELAAIGERLGLEVVPTLYEGKVASLDQLKALLDTPSMLGGEFGIEGVVVKNYARWGEDGKMLMGKVVRDDFREKHSKAWKKSNPGKGDIIEQLKDTYRSERRWEKAIERRRDDGQLQEAPQDIGPLLKDIQADVEEECRAEIADALFKAFWGDIRRGITAGFPEWYKARLAEQQFAADEAA